MTSAYDESKHNRASDGRFATKDGNRTSTGQVDDAFDDASVTAEHLAAEHEAVMQQFQQANLDFEDRESRYMSMPGGYNELPSEGDPRARQTRDVPQGRAVRVPAPSGWVERRIESRDSETRESHAVVDDNGNRTVHTLRTAEDGRQTRMRTTYDKDSGQVHRIIVDPDGSIEEKDMLMVRWSRYSGLEAGMVDVQASDGFTYEVPSDEYEHGLGADFAVDPTEHRRWGHDHDGNPLERESSWYRGESLSHFVETSHSGERVEVAVGGIDGTQLRRFTGYLNENDSGDWAVEDGYGEHVDVVSIDVSNIRRLED